MKERGERGEDRVEDESLRKIDSDQRRRQEGGGKEDEGG